MSHSLHYITHLKVAADIKLYASQDLGDKEQEVQHFYECTYHAVQCPLPLFIQYFKVQFLRQFQLETSFKHGVKEEKCLHSQKSVVHTSLYHLHVSTLLVHHQTFNVNFKHKPQEYLHIRICFGGLILTNIIDILTSLR